MAIEESVDTNEGPFLQGGGLETGKSFISDIVAEPPEAVPNIAEKLAALEQGGGAVADVSAPAVAPETGAEAGGNVVRVNPQDWKHLKDWKGRPFDPGIHKVNLDGSPTIGTKNRLQCLAKGERNPVKVVFGKLLDIEEVAIETQEEAQAQAQACVDSGRVKRKARDFCNAYFSFGTLWCGLGFRKEKQKRQAHIEAAVEDYMLATGKEINLPPEVALIAALAGDIEEVTYLNVGHDPKEGALKNFFLKRLPFVRWIFKGKKQKQIQPVKQSVDQAEKGGANHGES